MKKEAIIDAVIPAYRPGAEFRELLKRLMAQSRPLRRIIIMNTRTEVDMRTMAEDIPGAEIHELDKSEFDHGGTRNRITLCVDDGSGQIVRLCNSPTACERSDKHQHHCCES